MNTSIKQAALMDGCAHARSQGFDCTCASHAIHDYPLPTDAKPLYLSSDVLDLGERRDSWAWALARFVWALMFWSLVAGCITFTVILVASLKGWI